MGMLVIFGKSLAGSQAPANTARPQARAPLLDEHMVHAMTEFIRASSWQREPSGLFTTSIDPRWLQGKGAYGGLLSAGLLRCMATVVDAARRAPRTLHVHYCAPAKVGPLQTEVIIERVGATMITLSARSRQEGKVVTLATATFAVPKSKPAPGAHFNDARMPEVDKPDTLEPIPLDVPLMPTFSQFLEYRFCIGEPPYSGSTEPARTGGWVRLREPCPIDAFVIAALIDSYPPAVLPRLDGPRAAASVNLTVDFHALPPLAPDAQLLLHSSSRVGDGGTTDEQQDLWSADGVLIASCRQLVALL